MPLFKSTPPTPIDLASPHPPPAMGTETEMKDYRAKELEEARHAEINGATAAAQGIDPEMEKRVVRKLDWNLVPLVMVLYLLSFLDRSNIGNAKIAGMSEDLDLVGDRYDWLLTVFYIAYIVFQWQIIMWKRIKPHYWATFMIFGWGLISSIQAAATSWAGEMVLRFLLGVFEAGYGPGIPYLLSFFYLRHELGFRSGIFLAAAPLATCFAGALAYGITSGHPSIANWKVLFLVEGLPTLVMCPFAFFFLPDTPHQARFLTEDEKRVALARGVRQAGHEERIGSIDWRDVGLTFLDAKAWFTALMYFSCNVSFSSLPVFLPTILNEMGYTAINAQGLSAPPYFVSWLLTILTTWLADRTQQRGLVIITMSIVGGVGYILLATTTAVAPRYLGVYLAAAGVFPCIANILPWVSNNQGSDTRRGVGFIILNFVGQCGPLLGTRVYPTTGAPRYVEGQAVCAGFMFFTTLLALGLRVLLQWENRKLDRAFGTVEEQRNRAAVAAREGDGKAERVEESTENYGPMFRYIL